MVIYEGIFFDIETSKLLRSIEGKILPITNEILHCTFKFRPEGNQLFDEVVGEEAEVLVTGYGCDGKNSGFLVELPEFALKYYMNYDNDDNLKPAHITVSLAKGAKAVDTANLDFKKLSKPFNVKGKFGYFVREGNNKFISYEKQGYQKTKK